jgi:small subunit ribosomal protein S5
VEQVNDKEFIEKLIKLNRVAKVVKGGRRFSFSAMMVVGDKKGKVGYGFGKANDVSDAIRKSIDRAKRNMVDISLKNETIPHEIVGEFKSSRIVMRPAAPGTGVIAGGPVRAVLEAVGVHNILSKSMGSRNSINLVKAVFDGLEKMLDAKKVAKNRGKTIKDMWG